MWEICKCQPLVHKESERGNLLKTQPKQHKQDNGTEIPEAWMPTIRKHLNQRRTKNQRTPEETMVQGNNSRIEMHQLQQTTMIHNAVPQPVEPIARRRLAVGSRNVAFHIKWLCRETTEQTYNIIQLPRWTTTYFITVNGEFSKFSTSSPLIRYQSTGHF